MTSGGRRKGSRMARRNEVLNREMTSINVLHVDVEERACSFRHIYLQVNVDGQDRIESSWKARSHSDDRL